ncbi:hypothetical protein [Tritonibacter scottomollicae]|uniref:hypothetical protein n=1 Tax=Tritonibacter scottomollicae TaxID=483013 RepID=UPI003AA9487C
MKNTLVAVLILAVLGLFADRSVQNLRSSKPLLTVVVPAGYCGELDLYRTAPDEARSERNYTLFNLTGESSILADFPHSEEGVRVTLAAFANDGALDEDIYFRVQSVSSWRYGSVTTYFISPTQEDCIKPTRVPNNTVTEIRRNFSDIIEGKRLR